MKYRDKQKIKAQVSGALDSAFQRLLEHESSINSNTLRNHAYEQAIVEFEMLANQLGAIVQELDIAKPQALIPLAPHEIPAGNAFDRLLGQHFQFYGTDNGMFKLNALVWEPMEQEDDYHSHLGYIYCHGNHVSRAIFARRALATVRVEKINEDDLVPGKNHRELFNGYCLIDVLDGHCWLKFGTDVSDSYYPLFRYVYYAKERKEG